MEYNLIRRFYPVLNGLSRLAVPTEPQCEDLEVSVKNGWRYLYTLCKEGLRKAKTALFLSKGDRRREGKSLDSEVSEASEEDLKI